MASFQESQSAGSKGGESGVSNALATFDKSQPQANLPTPNDKSAGYKALSEAFGQISQASFKIAEKMGEEQSNANFMQSANDAEQLKTNAQIQMIQNPDSADAIAKATNYTNDTIKKSAYVNREDRNRLDWMINRNQDSLNLKAAEANYQQTKLTVANKFWYEYPITMKQVTDAVTRGDMKTAKMLEDSLTKNALAAAKIGAISPEQLGRIHQTTLDMYDKASDLINAFNSPNGLTAEQYHAATASPFSSNSFDNIGQPVDQNTQWMASHLQTDRSVQGQFNALYTGQPVNLGVIATASDAEYQRFRQSVAGVNYVKGSIAAGTPFNLIAARIQNLENKPTPLTPAEDAAVKYWKSFNSRLGSDNAFYGVLGQTALGQSYLAGHQAQTESLQKTFQGTELASKLRENDNNFIGQNISLAQSLHMDWHYIKPIPAEWINEVKSSFQKEAPVLPALQRIEYINPEYRAYLADAMPRPHQGVAVWVAGATMGKTDSSFQADLIHANQEDVSPLGQAKTENEKSALITSAKEDVGTKPDNLWNDIINANDQMKTIYSYMSKLPGGGTTQQGFRQMAINYIYDQAARAGDVSLENKAQYVSNFVNNITKGFNMYQTDKALINLGDIPLTRTQDADFITNYALSEAYKNIHHGKSEAEFQASIDLNPLMVVSTPDARLVVVDRYGRAAVTTDGHEAFDMPYTSNMLHAAQKSHEQISDYLRAYGFSGKSEMPETKEGEFPEFITPQSVMIQNEAKAERAKQAKRNEQAILKSEEEQKGKLH